MEFAIVTVQRSLDLSKNYVPVQVGAIKIGLQTVQDGVAEIEIQGPEDISHLKLPVGTLGEVQGYTIICRDVGVAIPEEKKRRLLFFGGKSDVPEDGVMEAVLDVRWGDQNMTIAHPDKNMAYDVMLVRQYEILDDRPMVYNEQDTLIFEDLALQLGPKVEEGTRQYRNPKRAELRVKIGDKDEEMWQIKLDGKYHNKGGYRIKVTSYDIFNDWYQAIGLSIGKGRVKGEIDETEREISSGLSASDVGGVDNSRTRLDEAKEDPYEVVIKVGESKNINKVSIKLMDLKPGVAKVMFLSPKIARTELEHGESFDYGDFIVSLIGIHDDKAIIRVAPED